METCTKGFLKSLKHQVQGRETEMVNLPKEFGDLKVIDVKVQTLDDKFSLGYAQI